MIADQDGWRHVGPFVRSHVLHPIFHLVHCIQMPLAVIFQVLL
jgi:hypothetical protein